MNMKDSETDQGVRFSKSAEEEMEIKFVSADADDTNVDAANNENDVEKISCSSSDDGNHSDDNSNNGKGGPLHETAERFHLAERETRTVGGLRGFVILVLLLSTIGVACAVYFYTSGQEQEAFETHFVDDAHKVIQGISASIQSTIKGADAFVVSIVSTARSSNQSWPFVYIYDFDVQAEKFSVMTHALYICLYVLVDNQTVRADWQEFTAKEGPNWVEEALELQEKENMFQKENNNTSYWNVIWDYDEYNKPQDEWGTVGVDPSEKGPFMPNWQIFPVITTPTFPPYNWNLLSMVENEAPQSVLDTHKVAIRAAYQIVDPNDPELTAQAEADAAWDSLYLTSGEEPLEPRSDIYYPIIVDGAADWINVFHGDNYVPSEHHLGGLLDISFYWRDMIKDILPDCSNGVIVSFENPCNPTFAYEINGPAVRFLGAGSTLVRDDTLSYLEITTELYNLSSWSTKDTYTGIPLNKDICPFTIRVSPSATFKSYFISRNPAIFTTCAVAIFIFTSVVFIIYDFSVERRQTVVMETAARSDALVSSLFPSTVKDRLYTSQAVVEEEQQKEQRKDQRKALLETFSKAIKLPDGNAKIMEANAAQQQQDTDKCLPIADLFPEATIMFADIAGFTAWASTRDPTQVFILLEKLYGSFDRIAKRRGVFKIETIGDCYVAVVGVPKPRRNHAVIMARFATDIRDSMNTLSSELEMTLGPDTSSLALRVGLHSGPVTAGVLRGEKSRFQLFGDSMNTTARVETTGLPNKIHCSQKTADLLIAGGKQQWLTKRDELVEAKGKGKMQTYWIEPVSGLMSMSSGYNRNSESVYTGSNPDDPAVHDALMKDFEKVVGIDDGGMKISKRLRRLVDWNVKVFEELLKKLIAHRRAMGQPENGCNIGWQPNEGSTVRDEVVKSIDLPSFERVPQTIDSEIIELPGDVSDQLHHFILAIAKKYHSNSFHNFEHASHVTMSVNKLLRRITTMSNTLSQQEVYIHSFGIASDPMGQLALTFAALVHDVEHPGVPNLQLIKEDAEMAARYKNKSVAEQNSVDVAWSTLMEDSYSALRDYLFTSTEDMNRFRQFVVNFVMATDIFDPDLVAMRNQRWELAFSDFAHSDDPDALNRKATIVLEHVIQASDVCHTMQHWHIYQRWNRSLFREMYVAYKAGRSDKDPTVGWYNGELWFFDNYIIPLAEKLKECQVFGASSHEFLDFAYDNRLEWEHRGREIVEEMREKLEKDLLKGM